MKTRTIPKFLTGCLSLTASALLAAAGDKTKPCVADAGFMKSTAESGLLEVNLGELAAEKASSPELGNWPEQS